MASEHSYKTMGIRLLHIFHLKKASFLLEYALQWALPYSRILRGQLNASIRFAYLIIVTVHFSVVVWLLLGYK